MQVPRLASPRVGCGPRKPGVGGEVTDLEATSGLASQCPFLLETECSLETGTGGHRGLLCVSAYPGVPCSLYALV